MVGIDGKVEEGREMQQVMYIYGYKKQKQIPLKSTANIPIYGEICY